MAGYLSSALSNDEQIYHQGRITKWILLWPIFWAGVLYIPLSISIAMATSSDGIGSSLLAGLLIFPLLSIKSLISVFATEIGITNKKFIFKKGLISRNVVEIRLDKVESINVEQSILDRMFGCGTLIVNGTGAQHARVFGLLRPFDFRERFYKAIEK